MKAEPRPRRAITIAGFVLSLLVVLLYGLPVWLTLLLVVTLGVTFWKGGPFAALTTTLTLVAVTGLYFAVIKVAGLEQAIYFEPHAKYGDWHYIYHHKVYKRNVSTTMEVPHGNLQAMTGRRIAQPRSVRFETDSEGFRNSREYHGQRFILVGDSFVVGNGSDQADTLNEQLERDYAIATYNLGYSGDPYDYLTYVEGFRRRVGSDFRILLFLFEGNDFRDRISGPERRRWAGAESAAKRVRSLFSDRAVYRVTKVLYERAIRRESIEESKRVWVTALGSAPIGVYRPYMIATRRSEYRAPGELRAILDRMSGNLEHIFFIPTKFRVYHRHLAPDEALPHAQWSALRRLCEDGGWACTDLTPPLVERSDELLADGEMTWWRDDTHWNGNGIAVAARAVAEVVAPSGAGRIDRGGSS